MALRYSDVVFHHAAVVDFTSSSNNGEGLGVVIPNDQLNSVFPEVSATEREAGKVSRVKIIVTNESPDRVLKDAYFFIAQDVFAPDRVKIYEADENTRLYATTTTDIVAGTVAGTNFPVDNIEPLGTVIDDFAGRKIFIGEDEYEIDTVSGSDITLTADIISDIPAGTKISMRDLYDSVELNAIFNENTAKVNTVMKTTFQDGVNSVYVDTVEATYFSVGDKMAIMDNYYRVIFRATITDIATDGEDASRTILTLDKTYTGAIVVPSNEGYVANAVSSTVNPGEGKSFWVEMTIGAVQTVDAEILNKFQITIFFDDVAA